jgi:hypothetical protein
MDGFSLKIGWVKRLQLMTLMIIKMQVREMFNYVGKQSRRANFSLGNEESLTLSGTYPCFFT